jgi:D-serine dehydratase
MQTMLSGCFTVEDEKLYPYLAALKDSTGIFIEPSACAAFEGLQYICGGEYVPAPDENAIHVIWATGGNMVPEDEKTAYYERGKKK